MIFSTLLSFLHKPQNNSSSSLPLVFWNTLHNEKEVFEPLNPKLVKMYNCGPTVYDEQHIGNMRPYVFADVLKRTLTYNKYPVKQVINITDVGHLVSDDDEGEDKMEAGAARAGTSAKKLADKITKLFKEDLEKLNIQTDAITFTRATDFIEQQIVLIQTLEEKGYTYKIDDGIYFDTARFAEYGKLGKIKLAELKEGARVEANAQKRNPTDFALWKFSPQSESGQKREQEWNSPWGVGFPGWHAECTAMIFSELGKQIDIHTGGIDHIPIHHNNEIAQAEAITQKQYVRCWMHNAFITIDGQKISKSIGNTILLRQLEARGVTPRAYRYWLLTGHYRSPMNFTWEAIEGAQKAFERLLRVFVEELGSKNGKIDISYQTRFHKAVNDDLDTPQALAILWELIRDEAVNQADKRVTLLDFDRVLGLGLIDSHRKLKGLLTGLEKKVEVQEVPQDVRDLAMEREAARDAKEYERADQLREQIAQKGYHVTDTDSGPEFRKTE